MAKTVFGVDIGGSSLKFGAFGEDGSLIEKWSVPTDLGDGGERIIPDTAASIRDRCALMGLSVSDIAGIGVGIPGAVGHDGWVNGAVNLGWGLKNVEGELAVACGVPVKAENDANAALLGEAYAGAAKDSGDIIMITLGTGVGGGIISGGRLIKGAAGSGAEIGHINVDPEETEYCSCGARGCLEQYCSIRGLTRIASRLLQTFPSGSRLREMSASQTGFSVRELFDAARAGDEIAGLAVNIACGYLGRGAACAANITNPSVILIGGGISGSADMIIERMKPAFDHYIFPACRGVDIRPAALGNDAGIIGASRLIFDGQRI